MRSRMLIALFPAARAAALLTVLVMAPASWGAPDRPNGAEPIGHAPHADTWEPAPPIPANPAIVFDSGTPITDPFALCGGCYPWTSTYRQSAGNYDFTARRFTVPANTYVTSMRLWWAYGDEGPHPIFANLGGEAADFTSITLDLYLTDGPGGAPGTLLANVPGAWTLLHAPTHYREFVFTTPIALSGTDYYVALRAETTLPDYQATILWFACATPDPLLDYEDYVNLVKVPPTGGWIDYPSVPGSPCPFDMNFGLQVLGLPITDAVIPTVDGPCISILDPCATVQFDFTRIDTTPARLVSTTFQLSSNLDLCAGLGGSIHDLYGSGGAWLSGPYGHTLHVTDNGGGSYTVDVAVLGLPCGPTAGGSLFTVDLTKKTGEPDGPGSVTVTSVVVRDCDNGPLPALSGASAALSVDTTPPIAVSDLSAVQWLAGNDANGTTKIGLSWTPPSDAAAVEVYRAKFGNYPEYDDAPSPGSVPPAPTYPPPSRWSLLPAITAPGADEPPGRDFWYYALFSKDACGNVSAASNVTQGTLNYHLGDVHSGISDCAGENQVDVSDLSYLGSHYFSPSAYAWNCLDVGPTSTGSVDGRPLTDSFIEFEDLMLFAMNYGLVSREAPVDPPSAAATSERPRVELRLSRTDGSSVASLHLLDHRASVRGLHLFVRLDPNDLDRLQVAPGALQSEQPDPLFFESPRTGDGIWIDLAALGPDGVLKGYGEVAQLRVAGDWTETPRLVGTSLRDRANLPIGGESPADTPGPVTSVTAALSVEPNPFSDRVTLHFTLPEPGPVRLDLFDVAGRLVQRLLGRECAAGSHALRWDGRDAHGRRVAAGLFWARLTTPEGVETRSLFRIR
ncbi:MAG: hypothetical protein IPK72_20910 [Candidatus Eisenbacteria bacterium]|nr:hypothetical protein [Candidatus Eisenbacteria bacterium]